MDCNNGIDKDLAKEGNYQNLRNAHTYRKARSEITLANRKTVTSRDVSEVVQKCREDYKLRDPYVRLAGEPFRIHMYSRQQLNTVGPQDKIAYFDASGGFVRKPEMQLNANQSDPVMHKVILYYAMLIRKTYIDANGKGQGISIPLMEMITCEHDITSIAYILAKYRAFVVNENLRWPCFRVIVVDWSWATIHAIVREWMETNIGDYLQTIYECLISGKGFATDFILIYYCCAHNQHRISKALKRNFPQYEKVKQIVLDCTAIMTMCRTIHELDEAFENTITILMTKSKKSAAAAMTRLNVLRAEASDNHETDVADSELDMIALVDEQKYSAIYRNSPFYKRYKHIEVQLEKNLRADKTEENDNDLHAPEIAENLTKSYMSFAPMWTAIALNRVLPGTDRLSNATAEGFFNIVKHQILKSRTNISAGEFIDTMRAYRNEICSRKAVKDILHHQEKMCKTKQQELDDPDDAELADDPRVTEGWDKKKANPKKRKRASYFEGKNIESAIKKMKLDSNKDDRSDRNHERNVNVSAALELINIANFVTNGENLSQNFNLERADTQSILEVDRNEGTKLDSTMKRPGMSKSQVSCSSSIRTTSSDSLHDAAFVNGLFPDEEYYMQKIYVSPRHVMYWWMGQYACDLRVPVIEESCMSLMANDYKTLKPRAYISSNVIDTFAIGNIGSAAWNNVNYIPTTQTLFIMGVNYNAKRDDRWPMYHVEPNFSGTVLLPYAFNKHWLLIVLDVANKTLKHIDPITRCSGDKSRAIQALKKFFDECKTVPNSRNNLCNIEWATIDDDEERPLQRDSCNCGAYLMYFMDCIGRGKPLAHPTFKPAEFRKHVARQLLILSQPMIYVCYICSRESDDGEWSVQCKKCKHWVHIKCVKRTEHDNTDYVKEKDAIYVCKPCSRQERPWMEPKFISDVSELEL